jgi:hypothetical protein
LWRIDQLLSKNHETSNEYSRCYATGISEQRFGKNVPAETRLTQQYIYNGNDIIFYVDRSEELKKDNWVNPVQLSVVS